MILIAFFLREITTSPGKCDEVGHVDVDGVAVSKGDDGS